MNTAVEDKIFDVTLSDDQRMNREAVQRFAAAEIRVASKDADEAGATPESFYTKTLDLGLTLMPIPEVLGGAGVSRSPISNALNAEDWFGLSTVGLSILLNHRRYSYFGWLVCACSKKGF